MYVLKTFLRLVLGLSMGLAGVAEEPACHGTKTADGAKDPVSATFERLKGLVGDWEQTAPAEPANKGKTVLSCRLTGGGSALVETIFPGTDMEMLSVYHRDGDRLVMTHYCAAGNQPRMQARPGAKPDEVIFEFVGGANLDPRKDWHIHGGRIRFVDADHIRSEWYVFASGKEAGKHTFDLVRKKK